MDFITAFCLGCFQIRMLGLGLHISPTLVDIIDQSLSSLLELHHHQLMKIADGFHLVSGDKVIIFELFFYSILGLSRCYGLL